MKKNTFNESITTCLARNSVLVGTRVPNTLTSVLTEFISPVESSFEEKLLTE